MSQMDADFGTSVDVAAMIVCGGQVAEIGSQPSSQILA